MEEQLAVFQLIFGSHIDDKDEISFHASLPYISSVRNVQCPYHRIQISKEYQNDINRKINIFNKDLRQESSQKRISSPPIIDMKTINPKNPRKFDTDNIYKGIQKNQQLYRISKQITNLLRLHPILDYIYPLSAEGVTLLQIVTHETGIPWDWIYNDEENSLLCEKFGIGVTFPEMPTLWIKDFPRTKKELADSGHSALIIGNSYNSVTGRNCLPEMRDEIETIGEIAREIFGRQSTFVKKDVNHQDFKNILSKNLDTLRLIFLMGHYDEKGYYLEDGTLFTSIELEGLINKSTNRMFSSYPIVILNGCSSQYSSQSLAVQLNPTRDFAKSFLKFGAAACIVTNTDVRFEYAKDFAKLFLSYFFTPNISIGTALLKTRREMKSDECYEWASYHLLGDPTYTMIRSN